MLERKSLSGNLRTEEGATLSTITSKADRTKKEKPRKMCEGFVSMSTCRKYLEMLQLMKNLTLFNQINKYFVSGLEIFLRNPKNKTNVSKEKEQIRAQPCTEERETANFIKVEDFTLLPMFRMNIIGNQENSQSRG